MASLPAAGHALDDPPHPLPGPDPLHEVGGEEADPVAAFTLEEKRDGDTSPAQTGRRHLFNYSQAGAGLFFQSKSSRMQRRIVEAAAARLHVFSKPNNKKKKADFLSFAADENR